MKSLEAYKIEIVPTVEQAVLLKRHCDLARFAYNWALGKREDWWRRNSSCEPQELADRRQRWKDRGDLSREDKRALWWSLDLEPSADPLSLLWTETHGNRRTEEGAYWFHGELERSTVTYALKAVDDAFKHYFRRRKANDFRRCHACVRYKRRYPCKHCFGYPRFKRPDEHDAFTVQDQEFRAEERAVRIGTKIGMIRTHEPILPVPRSDTPAFRARWLRGRVLRISVSRHADRWYASLMVERDREDPTPNDGPVIGVDLGISLAATFSDGRVLEPAQVRQHARVRGPNDPHRELNRADQLQRQLAHLERIKAKKLLGGKQWQRVVDKIARLHKHIADARADHLHNASRIVSTTASAVVTEGYNVRELAERRGPTRGQVHASDVRRKMMQTGLGELRRQLEYKGKWYGARFEKTAADYPSDQTCNLCGHVNEHMRERSDSRFDCKRCGHTSTRQINTAELLARLGRGEPFPADPIPQDDPPKSSKGRKPRRSPAAHAGTDTPGGASTSHGASVPVEAAPMKGEASRTEDPLGHPREGRGTA